MMTRALLTCLLLVTCFQPEVSARFRSKEARYDRREEAWDLTPGKSQVDCSRPCVTYCPVVRYVKQTRRVPQKVCVPEEINCRQVQWEKIKYKQLVCKMVPQYSYKECYRFVPRYTDQPTMRMRSRTVFNDEVYYVPEYTYEKSCTPPTQDVETDCQSIPVYRESPCTDSCY